MAAGWQRSAASVGCTAYTDVLMAKPTSPQVGLCPTPPPGAELPPARAQLPTSQAERLKTLELLQQIPIKVRIQAACAKEYEHGTAFGTVLGSTRTLRQCICRPAAEHLAAVLTAAEHKGLSRLGTAAGHVGDS